MLKILELKVWDDGNYKFRLYGSESLALASPPTILYMGGKSKFNKNIGPYPLITVNTGC